MQTTFTDAQLADPDVAESNKILRACVHCGFCTATCPTYQVLGDELDSPRGRIYLIKEMLENGRPADAKTVKHIDRCLSCLACMTTCPSGVHYQHLVDHARAHIEETYKRPFLDRAIRSVLATVLPRPGLFRASLTAARLSKPLARGRLGRALPARVRAMLDLAPNHLPPADRSGQPATHVALGRRRARVALLAGCAQKVLAPEINAATIRLLTRLGVEVVVADGAGCCGALTHHIGKTDASHASAAANIRAWSAEIDGAGLDAVIVNASGCGTTVKDYGHMFRTDPTLADAARRISEMTKDVSEFLDALGPFQGGAASKLRIAYHSACSLQHGQKVTTAPKRLLKAAGFEVVEPKEAHLCCGSAGVYNLLQPEIAGQLRDRKTGHLAALKADAIASGNIGCLTQIGSASSTPVVHTIELLDWASGGPKPPALLNAEGASPS